MPKLTPTMRRQLQALADNKGHVNLSTVRALMNRGLVVDNARTREELHIHCRLPGAYPLTTEGRAALEKTP